MALREERTKELVDRIAEHAQRHEWGVPEFQRGFVWKPEQVRALAHSLYMDYPVGALLLWNYPESVESRTLREDASRPSYWIVDGQQRITAISIMLGKKPYWFDTSEWNRVLEKYDILVKVVLDEDEEDVDFAVPKRSLRADPRWCRLREILTREEEELPSLAQEIVNRAGQNSGADLGKVLARLNKIYRIKERSIPVIEISHNPEDVAEIFIRVNQQGTKVKWTDSVLSYIALFNPGWVRDELRPYLKELENSGWELDPGIVIRTIAGVAEEEADVSKVKREFWGSDAFRDAWPRTRAAINASLNFLADKGLVSELIPAKASLIPFFTLWHRWGNRPNLRKKFVYWLLMANWSGRFVQGSRARVAEDVRVINDAQNFQEAYNKLLENLEIPDEIEEDAFKDTGHPDSKFAKTLLFMMLVERGARDWFTGVSIGSGRVGQEYKVQWHHIFPKSLLQRRETPPEKINAAANLTVVEGATNRTISNQEPWEYLQRYAIRKEILKAHLIPPEFAEDTSKRMWSLDKFEDFLEERAKLLAQEANEFLKDLRS